MSATPPARSVPISSSSPIIFAALQVTIARPAPAVKPSASMRGHRADEAELRAADEQCVLVGMDVGRAGRRGHVVL